MVFKGLSFDPSLILSDFESGLISAVKQAIPKSKHLGIHFHFSQAIWRKVQELQVSAPYKTDDNVAKVIQGCQALAFVPLPKC